MADTSTIYDVTPRQLFAFLCQVFEAGLVPFVQGSPGVGKSAIMAAVCRHFGLKMIDHRLSTSAPEDLSGLPRFDEQGFAHFAPFADLFPVEGTPVPEGYNGWMIFLDEMNSAAKSVQAAAYKLVLDKMVGQRKLHSHTILGAAGNQASDRAIVNALSTAMQSRMVHFRLKVSHREWMEDVALKEGYDDRIVAYLSFKKEALLDFRPDHDDKTFCCPRTWEFMNRLVKGREVTDEQAPLYAGTITSGAAVDFIQFTKVFADLPAFTDIVAAPTGIQVPDKAATRWALVTHILGEVSDQTFGPVAEYMSRFPIDFQVLFLRSLLIRKPEFKRLPAFGPMNRKLEKHLKDD